MSCAVGCPAVHKLVDDSACKTCFYHPLPSDVSVVRCRYPFYRARVANLRLNIRRKQAEIHMQKELCEKLRAPDRKAEADRILRKREEEKEQLKLRLDLNKKMMREAFETNDPLITEVEDYLSDLTRQNDLAEKIFLSKKNLQELYTIFRQESITKPENAIRRALEYYQIDCGPE